MICIFPGLHILHNPFPAGTLLHSLNSVARLNPDDLSPPPADLGWKPLHKELPAWTPGPANIQDSQGGHILADIILHLW